MLVYRREAYIKNNEVALAFQCCSITACISLEDDSYQTAGVSITHFSGDDFFVCVWKNVINLVAFVFHFLAFIFMEGRRTRGKPGGEECWPLLQESKEQRSPWQAASQRGAAWHLWEVTVAVVPFSWERCFSSKAAPEPALRACLGKLLQGCFLSKTYSGPHIRHYIH